jgi:YD repeat-containing protein
VITEYAYNAANLATSLTNRQGANTLSTFTYAYTPDGNQVLKTDGKRETTYSYDHLGRLAHEYDEGWQSIRYHYDRFGNRAKMRVTAAPNTIAESYTVSYNYDSNNRLLTEITKRDGETETNHYAYDANGNQIWREWERSTLITKNIRREHVGFAGMDGGRPMAAPTRGRARLDTREYDGLTS